MNKVSCVELPGLNCGLCGYRTCNDFSAKLMVSPELAERCIHLSASNIKSKPSLPEKRAPFTCGSVSHGATCSGERCAANAFMTSTPWVDSLGREFDFYLEHFPEDPGPREVIIPHNPLITREMDLTVGDILIGRPLGMSCGCPITHCGVVTEVDHRTGVLTWCVTGPLGPREHGFKDIGYYIAEAYEGLVKDTKRDLRLGLRYYFQPRMCMLQWRHSGLINYVNRTDEGYQIRLEGLFIG